jgi:hypothetical protein
VNFVDGGFEWIETTTLVDLNNGVRTFLKGKQHFTNPEGASLEDIEEYVRERRYGVESPAKMLADIQTPTPITPPTK